MSDASLNVFTSPLERPFENVKYGFNDGAVDGAVVIFEDSKTRQGYVDICDYAGESADGRNQGM